MGLLDSYPGEEAQPERTLYGDAKNALFAALIAGCVGFYCNGGDEKDDEPKDEAFPLSTDQVVDMINSIGTRPDLTGEVVDIETIPNEIEKVRLRVRDDGLCGDRSAKNALFVEYFKEPERGPTELHLTRYCPYELSDGKDIGSFVTLEGYDSLRVRAATESYVRRSK